MPRGRSIEPPVNPFTFDLSVGNLRVKQSPQNTNPFCQKGSFINAVQRATCYATADGPKGWPFPTKGRGLCAGLFVHM
ncbi:hypothetical protein JTE90_021851 [Oedothorax gibbosus]|uniref:Uncharacterized protein n=1 Tax=Oedothorax gibbosus TaxID=931172 RepID=A0AAV6V199_9ARAC|nr:hypothetical protein JTE90_021851 [Oedothorax gibbosus]